MSKLDISDVKSAQAATTGTDYSVDTVSTDGPADQKETTYTCEHWTQWLGYYKTIAELSSSIDAKATWTVGKGFQADEGTTFILDRITGWGKDTFNTIIENMIRTYHIAGDAYAEIITDPDGYLINLKPLDPSSIRIVADRKGVIIRYEQISKIKLPTKKFKPDQIFHLARNRVADEIHGVSIIPILEPIILMRNEAMADWKRVMHRNVDPLWVFHLDTDDATKIAAFKAKMDEGRGKGENIYIPKGAVVPELISTAGNASLNPLTWIDNLNEYFYEACGVPKIIIGSSRVFTEASAKIAYLAFQQTIEEEQLFVEEQVLNQLNLWIQLEFPASLENEMLSDKPKEPEVQKEKASEPNDATAELEGRR